MTYNWTSSTDYARGYRDGWEGRPLDPAGDYRYREGFTDGQGDKADNDGQGPTWEYASPNKN